LLRMSQQTMLIYLCIFLAFRLGLGIRQMRIIACSLLFSCIASYECNFFSAPAHNNVKGSHELLAVINYGELRKKLGGCKYIV